MADAGHILPTPRTLEAGEVITEAGLYIIPIERYHGDPDLCDGPSISSTGLRQILDCPAKYWAYSPYNPSRIEREHKRTFDFGKAAHSLILEGNLPADEYAISPYPDFRKAAAQEWRDAQQALGKTVVKASDIETIEGMAERIRAHPIVQAGGLDGLVEASLIWRDDETGVWLRARPDVIPIGNAIVDYKTVADASIREIGFSIARYRYDIQAALVAEGMAKVLDVRVENAGLLCQEKEPPFVVAFYEFSDAYLASGLTMARQAIRTFDACMKSGFWPGYPEDNASILAPDHIVKAAFGKPKADIGVLDNIIMKG